MKTTYFNLHFQLQTNFNNAFSAATATAIQLYFLQCWQLRIELQIMTSIRNAEIVTSFKTLTTKTSACVNNASLNTHLQSILQSLSKPESA